MAERYRSIARVVKAHGRKGEVVVVPTHGLPFLLSRGMEVALVPPQLRERRRFVVEGVTEAAKGWLVAFSGVSDLGLASQLAGRTVLAREADLPEDLSMLDLEALIGREVADEDAGVLGTIAEVMVGPANDVWVLEGERGEVLVPAVEELVVSFPSEGTIVMRLPEGLVEREEGEGER